MKNSYRNGREFMRIPPVNRPEDREKFWNLMAAQTLLQNGRLHSIA